MILNINSPESVQIWVLASVVSVLFIILAGVISYVAKFLGRKVEDMSRINEKLLGEVTKITEQIKSVFHSINQYEISMSDVEKRIRQIEIEHARNCGNCQK